MKPSPVPKRRVLRVEDGGMKGGLHDASRTLAGVKGITLAADYSGKLVVEYDLEQISYERIESLLLSTGLRFRGKLHEIQRGWWKFTEKNELENLRRPAPPCCNKPPVSR